MLIAKAHGKISTMHGVFSFHIGDQQWVGDTGFLNDQYNWYLNQHSALDCHLRYKIRLVSHLIGIWVYTVYLV